MPTLRHILAAPDGAGLYRLASRAPAAAIAARARERGWLPLVLDGAAVRGKADFLAASAAALAFPAYFGHNWDALAECLTDLAWLESGPGCCSTTAPSRFCAPTRPPGRSPPPSWPKRSTTGGLPRRR